MRLGTLDTPANVAARVLAILPRANQDPSRYAQVYGTEMAAKADALRILLLNFPNPELLAVDTPDNRAGFAALLALDADLVDRLTAVLVDGSPFRQVLTEELDEIHRLREIRWGQTPTPLPHDLQKPEQRAVELGVVGLAFSGGGIRSATFNLGVLQALAEHKVLRAVDYLSTVSGGGYIGSWLVSWIHKIGVHKVEEALSPTDSPYPQQDEVQPIEFLRDFSNYLAPRPGMFSADTWTILAVWSRNTFLNLLVLVASISCVLLLPRVLGYAAEWLLYVQGGLNASERFHPLLMAATFLLLPGVAFIALNLRAFSSPRPIEPPWWQRQAGVIATIVAPVALACFTGSISTWALLQMGGVKHFEWGETALNLLPAAAIICLLLVLMEHMGEFYGCFLRQGARPFMAIIALTTWPILATLAWLAMRTTAAWVLHRWMGTGTEGFWRMIVGGPTMMLIVFVTTLVLHEGLMGNSFPDDRREWLSRLGAWLGIVAISATSLCILSFYGPWSLAHLLAWGQGAAASGALLGWAGTTLSGLLATRNQNQTPESQAHPSVVRKVLATVAPYVFIAGLLIVLSSALTIGLGLSACSTPYARDVSFCRLWNEGGTSPTAQDLVADYWNLLSLTDGTWALAALLFFVAVTLLFAYRLDVNEFSLHHFYKNRLVRCYLGASRGKARRPDPFTGFDMRDDQPIASLRHDRPEGGYSGPYPILNTTLNLVKGERLSWQERKGTSFIFTPKYCGFANGTTEELAIDPEQDLGADVGSPLCRPAYRPTDVYAYPVKGGQEGGPALGTAMAISGAAASPNMGAQSTAALEFLMTIFDVRLGWWLGNPLLGAWQKSGPPFGLFYLLAEMFGLTSLRRKYIYLSDGGHFENLALYELIRRRCSLIISCDAEQDGELSFGGLGNAIRKCRTDFGVEIEIDPEPIRKDEKGFSERQFVTGIIRYPELDADGEQVTGTIVYLKSSLTGLEPPDLLNYQKRNPEFPHQTTGDQFFDESQFESYRTLGYLIATRALASGLHKMLRQ
jgi:hypothetical protein